MSRDLQKLPNTIVLYRRKNSKLPYYGAVRGPYSKKLGIYPSKDWEELVYELKEGDYIRKVDSLA